MSIKLIGAGGVEANVDINGSLNVTPLTDGGLPLCIGPDGVYYWGANVPVMAASVGVQELARGLLINTGPRDVYIRRIMLQMGFRGTEAATVQQWSIIRAKMYGFLSSSSTPKYSVSSKTKMHESSVYVHDLDSTSTSGIPTTWYRWISYGPIAVFLVPRRLNRGVSISLDFKGHNRIHLAPREALLIIHEVEGVVVDFISGHIFWEEKQKG